MVKRIFVYKGVTEMYILNPYSKDRREYEKFAFLKKDLVEMCRGRKIELHTNLNGDELSELSAELDIVSLKRVG